MEFNRDIAIRIKGINHDLDYAAREAISIEGLHNWSGEEFDCEIANCKMDGDFIGAEILKRAQSMLA